MSNKVNLGTFKTNLMFNYILKQEITTMKPKILFFITLKDCQPAYLHTN